MNEAMNTQVEKAAKHSASNRIGDKIFTIILLVVLFISFIIIGIFISWSIAPDQALEVKNAPMPVRPDPAKPKTAIFIHFNYCKNVSAKGTVRASLIGDNTEIFQPTQTDNQPKGCNHVDYPLVLPPQAVPGKYRVHFRTSYRLNPAKTVIQDFDSKTFMVE